MRKFIITARWFSGWVNSWDGVLSWYAGSNRMLSGFHSVHDNRREDRLYAFHSAAASGVSCRDTGLRGYANYWDAQLHFDCPNNQALSRIYSHHDNRREDRRWKFGCCVVSSNVYLQKGGWTNYINGWDAQLDFGCKEDEVLVGVNSYHDNRREDRRWRFRCSRLMTKR